MPALPRNPLVLAIVIIVALTAIVWIAATLLGLGIGTAVFAIIAPEAFAKAVICTILALAAIGLFWLRPLPGYWNIILAVVAVVLAGAFYLEVI